MRPALVAPPTPTLAELIAENWDKSTGELCTIIGRYHPAATTAEIVGELRRQAGANLAEADALERFRPGRAS